MKKNFYDAVIVGAGASGLMAAVTCARQGPAVLVLDAKAKPGAKILMSGGTRCNVTHREVSVRDFASENPRVVRDVLRAFSAASAVSFFEDAGVPLELQEDGKYFPVTHSGRTVLEGLLRQAGSAGAEIAPGRKVTVLERSEGQFRIAGEGFECRSTVVVLCTGGLSYPQSGSDGSGLSFAASLGHRIVPTTPALTPLETDDPDWKDLSGVALECGLSLAPSGSQKGATSNGPVLFTHFGFSGPCVLDISRHWLRYPDPRPELLADFLPREREQDLRLAWDVLSGERPKTRVKSFLAARLPDRLVRVLLKKAGIGQDLILNQAGKRVRESLCRYLFRCPLRVTGALGYSKAEVTAGGVDLAQVDPASLESRICPGLFFAGEILDVDGRIGGFNFQWAWSSGVVAGRGASRRLAKVRPGYA